MKIYHPSNKLFNIVKTKYFGENFYTLRDLKASKLPRTFWYLKERIPEQRFKNSKFLYQAEILRNSLYDLRTDNYNLITKTKNIDNLLRKIKRDYQGVIYNVGQYNIIALFNDIKAIRKRKVI